MARRLFLLFCALLILALGVSSRALADNSHARIVRLSLVQGDVRFAPSFRDDPLTDANAGWQAAPLNLPIRQGYLCATKKSSVSSPVVTLPMRRLKPFLPAQAAERNEPPPYQMRSIRPFA